MNEYLPANQALWEQRTPIHERSEFYDVEGWKAGRRKLARFVVEEVGDVTGKDLLHLQRHFGMDTHRAGLNFGDCMTYAVAKLAGAQLLCLGNDFPATDLEVVDLTG